MELDRQVRSEQLFSCTVEGIGDHFYLVTERTCWLACVVENISKQSLGYHRLDVEYISRLVNYSFKCLSLLMEFWFDFLPGLGSSSLLPISVIPFQLS